MWESRYIEFPLLLAHFGSTLSGSVDTNFIIYRTCTSILGCNETECAKLGSDNQDNSTRELEERVEPYANVITMSMTITGQILPALACLFIGHWSDKNGRKPILLASMLGHFCTSLIKVAVSLMPFASPWFMVLQIIPTILSGGFVTFTMICYCYLTETTAEENRSLRMGVLEVVFALAIIVGTTSSSYILAAVGYSSIYGIGATFQLLATIFVLLFIKESVVITDRVKLSEIFSINHIKLMINTVSKMRGRHKRTILVLLMTTMALYSFANSDTHIMFQFLRLRFEWDLRKFTFLLTWYFAAHSVATFIGMYVMQKLMKVPDGAMLILAYSSLIAGIVVTILATNDWYLYTAAGVQSFSAVINPIVRSMISKLVDTVEVGKIFSLTMVVEALCGIVSTPIYTIIYNETLSTYPVAFMFLAAAIYLVELCIIPGVIVLMRKETDIEDTTALIQEEAVQE